MRYQCAECGMEVESNEYHPGAYCVLVKAGINPKKMEKEIIANYIQDPKMADLWQLAEQECTCTPEQLAGVSSSECPPCKATREVNEIAERRNEAHRRLFT